MTLNFSFLTTNFSLYIYIYIYIYIYLRKKPTGDITICRLYQGLRFHTQREDGTNPTSIGPTKRNCCSNNDSL